MLNVTYIKKQWMNTVTPSRRNKGAALQAQVFRGSSVAKCCIKPWDILHLYNCGCIQCVRWWYMIHCYSSIAYVMYVR